MTGRGDYYLVDGSPIPIVKTDCIAGPEEIREHVKSAVSRCLPEVRLCNPHDHVLSVVGGGPSLKGTVDEVSGYIGSVNGSHDYLISKGMVPNACSFLDPDPIVAKIFEPRDDVTYFVASMCHPDVFDKLRGKHVVLWHASNGEACDIRDLIKPDSVLIGGGSTVSLRWINLGYVCGFRKMKIHGMDSSFHTDVHAYPQIGESAPEMELYGYKTTIGMCAQMSDFFRIMDRMSEPDIDPIDLQLYGDGLLQFMAKRKGFNVFNNQ